VEFHVLLAKDLSVQQAHDLADHLEDDIKVEFPRTHVTIHMEPCEEECATCEACCNLPRTFCPAQKNGK
jgi:divalent metal cation (Fe/Co/Zn/Cd) transporter